MHWRRAQDPCDSAFAKPTKPIGIEVDETRARGLIEALGWVFRQSGSTWRRVVPSPEPIDVLELAVIRRLVTSGVVMGPKAEACCRFVEETGRPAAIGALSDAEAVLRGECGTEVVEGPRLTECRADG